MDKHLGTVIFVGMTLATLLVGAMSTAKETTTLEDALERPVEIQKYVDKENNVVCYWAERYPKYLSCFQLMTRHVK